MSSFFTAPASQRKRKRPENGGATRPRKRHGTDERRVKSATSERPRPAQEERDDSSISGSDGESVIGSDEGAETDVSSEEDETAADRRVRLAQRYLERIKGEVDEAGFDAEDLDKDIIARRLKEDVDEARGRQFRLIANALDLKNSEQIHFRADTLATTAVAVCKPYVYTVSKDKCLIKWQTHPTSRPQVSDSTKKRGQDGVRRKPKQLAFVKGIKIRAALDKQHGHTASILSIAASPDGNFVATGGADKKLIIWRASDLTPLKTFYTHRDAVTGLDFAPSSGTTNGFGAQLFSSSMDRSIKTYSLAGEESLAYVETLFGHQDHVTAVSSVSVDQCVSVGARDRSARWWKVVDETQLKFLGDSSRNDEYQTGSIDCVAAVPPQHFVTGTDSGSLQLWSVHKKKSLFTVHTAHGVDPVPPLEEVTSEADPKVIEELKRSDQRKPQSRAITALVALPGTDVVLSGSWDGWIRIWKVSDDKRSLTALGLLGKPAEGVQTENIATTEDVHMDGIATNGVENQALIDNFPLNQGQGPLRGIINGLAVFERRKETVDEFGGKKEGTTEGLCIVAGVGKETRLGRWVRIEKGRNGAVLFEVPVKTSASASAQE